MGWFGGQKLQTPSNVTRITHAIPCEDKFGSPQVVYYQAGVGTGLGIDDQLLGGATGSGLAEHIREGYSFLANNYGSGDLIYLLGFSRGAFTARSLAGLIGQLGLLNKKGLAYFYEIFEDWEHAGDPDFDGPLFLKNYHDEVTGAQYSLDTPANVPSRAVEYLREYRVLLQSLGLMHKAPARDNPAEEVRIQAVACWDTVGALGIPVNPFFQKFFKLPAFLRLKNLRWMDTSLTDNIMNAFQALALDEHRAPFSPAVWERPEGCKTNLKQVWFPGAHSGIGGGYDDTGSADISLAWMMDQLAGQSSTSTSPKDPEKWIQFDDDFIPYLHQLHRLWHQRNPPFASWAKGALYKSFKFPVSLLGWINRTPGRYRRLHKKTLKPQHGVRLRDTNELIHASVRARVDLGGAAPVDNPKDWHIWSSLLNLVHTILRRTGKEVYRPAALKGWLLRDGHDFHDDVAVNNVHLTQLRGSAPWYEWVGDDKHVAKGERLHEDHLGKFELQLLHLVTGKEEAEDIEASNRGADSTANLRRMQERERDARRSETI
ncbi:hypothetical protein AAFC00_003087 [Neodothiora populina]|uniref:T6SS Phospholipase effector Tle1-like catalytic domain-containing protein n=1 Tax=Neodothiora populina TaxID=2781224 RepID=A0ABR3P989_9PEZI